MLWRKLQSKERDILETVFGDKLNIEPIRLGRSFAERTAFAFGNWIFCPSYVFKSDFSLKKRYRPLLIHEATHVYQHQNAQDYYLGLKPLWTYAAQVVQPGYDAYDIAKPELAGLHWQELTPDEQAEILTEVYLRQNQGDQGYPIDDSLLERWYGQFLAEDANVTGSHSARQAFTGWTGPGHKS